MNALRIAAALLLAPTASILLAQTPALAKDPAPPSSTEPLTVDVHASPYRPSIDFTLNISAQRVDLRNATIVNMIDFANGRNDDDGREDDGIVGGPTWLDLDRFDIAALIPSLKPATLNAAPPDPAKPPPNPYDQIRPVIKRVLAERFHLTYHTEDRPLPGYIATVAKDGAKLTEAKDPAAPVTCKSAQDKANPGQVLITCTSETMAQVLALFGGVFRHPIVDHTGLTKQYDFTLKLAPGQVQTREDAIHAYSDAFAKQLGIVLAPGTVPQPAIVVDKVDRTPTPNPPEIAKLIPALPDLEFDVASIRPSADNEPQDQIRPLGSQITFSAFNMQGLLTRAFDLPTGAMLGSTLDTLSKQRYTILVKLPPEIDARAVFQDQDELDNMLQKLLIDRFKIKYHWGQQTQDGYSLLAGPPKMKKADPNSRSYCKYGPPDGEKDVRTGDSAFDREFHCQNVTMAQFADLAQAVAKSEIKNRVPDKTGLAGAYDFTLFYTTGHKMRVDATAAQTAAQQAGGTTTSDPIVGLTIEDAFRKQLGIRLERQAGPYPTLILDHIEPTPTEN